MQTLHCVADRKLRWEPRKSGLFPSFYAVPNTAHKLPYYGDFLASRDACHRVRWRATFLFGSSLRKGVDGIARRVYGRCAASNRGANKSDDQAMTLGTRITTWLTGDLVGTDVFGNRYYQERRKPKGRRPKRWVLYKGDAEGSKVPAAWHAWLHHTTDAPVEAPMLDWMKPHLPNLTGTRHAYVPPGHDRRGGQRDHATGDYEAWRPDTDTRKAS